MVVKRAVGRGLAIGVALLTLVCASCGTPPTFKVMNVDGPEVTVTPWVGGPSITIECGQDNLSVDTSKAPPQPWRVTVTATVGHAVLLRQSRSGDVEVVVRRGGALIGSDVASGGPAGTGCSSSP